MAPLMVVIQFQAAAVIQITACMLSGRQIALLSRTGFNDSFTSAYAYLAA